MKAIFYNGNGVGHINPTLPIVKTLKETGGEVLYHTSFLRKPLVEAAGAQFCNYGSDDFNPEDYNPGKNFVQQLIPSAEAIIPFLAKKLEEFSPDVLFYDSMSPWGYCLGQMFKIPAVCCVSTFALSPEKRQQMYDFYGITIDDINQKAIDNINDKYGVHLRLIDALGSYGDCNIVFTAKKFNPDLGSMPQENFHFIGPMVSTRNENINFPIETFKSAKEANKKIIYMSLGTILGGDDPSVIELFRDCLKAFANHEKYSVILSIGNALRKDDLGTIPENCFVYNYVPQLEVLKIADLFINHAGMNSVNEGLYFATPLVVIPISGDAFANADRVHELEVGIRVYRDQFAEVLCGAVQQIFQGEYQNNCAAMSKDFQSCVGYQGVFDIIASLEK